MVKQMEWDNIYELWKRGCYYFPQSIDEPLVANPVFVEYNREGFIYGYDWLSNEDAINRKQMIKDMHKSVKNRQ